MNNRALQNHLLFKSALGVALAVVCGLALWKLDLGDAWENASYDYLFRFGPRPVTNQVVVLEMDKLAYDYFKQQSQKWDRELHAEVLHRLADDKCSLVVLDSLLRGPRDPTKDAALAAAMQRHSRIVLMAEPAGVTHYAVTNAVRPTRPTEPFLSAASNHWGIAWLDPDLDSIVRRHWPFPSPAPHDHLPRLPMMAAQMAGVSMSAVPQERWLRYYGVEGSGLI